MDTAKFNQQSEKKINAFSGRFMSNNKWLKVFQLLSQHSNNVNKCLIKTIWDDRLQEIHIPDFENFDRTFHHSGITDILIGGPLSFKEIEWIEFPSAWTHPRLMRNEELESFKCTQDILLINEWLNQPGQLEIERTPQRLIIYGYK